MNGWRGSVQRDTSRPNAPTWPIAHPTPPAVGAAAQLTAAYTHQQVSNALRAWELLQEGSRRASDYCTSPSHTCPPALAVALFGSGVVRCLSTHLPTVRQFCLLTLLHLLNTPFPISRLLPTSRSYCTLFFFLPPLHRRSPLPRLPPTLTCHTPSSWSPIRAAAACFVSEPYSRPTAKSHTWNPTLEPPVPPEAGCRCSRRARVNHLNHPRSSAHALHHPRPRSPLSHRKLPAARSG